MPNRLGSPAQLTRKQFCFSGAGPRGGLEMFVVFVLVPLARWLHPIPSRTRKLSILAPMVLSQCAWESRAAPAQRPQNLATKSTKNSFIFVLFYNVYVFNCF